ncbi:acyl carrier protein [Flavobacteriaceae bacterium 14752]|uniref:acyl carrier protein n=1 Tax=Mesohalobacter salilacus TaxID=2491711 RepID=UPI000F63D344|nr:acyl carrier protein [Flavobacteriaceae bacterium 14752]
MSYSEQEISEKLKSIVEPYVNRKEGLKDLNTNTEFIKDLEINSANLVDVILDVEDEFDIRIENDEMEKMLSVGASLEIIQSKIS